MLPDYSIQIKKAEHQRLIRSIESDVALFSRLRLCRWAAGYGGGALESKDHSGLAESSLRYDGSVTS